MESSVYDVESEVEATHWWFVGRRKLFENLIKPLRIPCDATILDVGSGTGSNLRLLKNLKFSNVTGVDQSEVAIRYCEEKNLGPVRQADVCDLPFCDGEFQFILATDVVEHVDEKKALAEIYRALAPGGYALFTVPAFQMLWGLQDEVSHHRIRYRKNQFEKAVHDVGFIISQSFYFNYLMFGPILIARKIIKLFNIKLESEGQINSPWINRIMKVVFSFDIHTSPRLNLPFGVSILTMVCKPND